MQSAGFQPADLGQAFLLSPGLAGVFAVVAASLGAWAALHQARRQRQAEQRQDDRQHEENAKAEERARWWEAVQWMWTSRAELSDRATLEILQTLQAMVQTADQRSLLKMVARALREGK